MLSDGRIRYSPPRDFAGVASFVYEVCGEPGHCGRTTVRVVVRPVNDEPVARDDVLSVAEDTPIRVAVLANDTDPDGDALNVTAVSNLSAGSATIEQNHVELELPDDANGKIAFDYVVTDGKGGRGTPEERYSCTRATTRPSPWTTASAPRWERRCG